jgi:hypothetical protein
MNLHFKTETMQNIFPLSINIVDRITFHSNHGTDHNTAVVICMHFLPFKNVKFYMWHSFLFYYYTALGQRDNHAIRKVKLNIY